MLYSDVRHIYGPLSPWVHAALYRMFGPSLDVLYIDGIVCAAIVLALVYWLARRIMEPAAGAGATLNVLALCVIKPSGNYILPYSYNSLHGVVLGLTTLAILTRALTKSLEAGGPALDEAALPGAVAGQRQGPGRRSGVTLTFVTAGFTAGLTVLAKTEMGAAAVAAGLAAALVAAYPDVRRGIRFALSFAIPAAVLPAIVYAALLARVGWTALAVDSWLLIYNMPPEIAYFNGQISGLGDPVRSIGRMLIATGKLGIVALIIAAISNAVVAFRYGRESSEAVRPWRQIGLVFLLIAAMSLTTGLDKDKGPFLAGPFLFIGLLVTLIADVRRENSVRTATLLTFTVYCLVSLLRVFLHVRSGGAYASYLLPVAVVLLTYLWVGPFVARFRDVRVAAVARAVVVFVIVAAGIVNAALLGHRVRRQNTTPIATARGTMIARPDMAQAFNEALAYVAQHTRPGDAIAVLPEGTALTFFSERRNPLREEIITPGYLDEAGESRAIRQLEDAKTALILVPNRPTLEFGPAVFGRDYSQRLMRWIEDRYTRCAVFGPVKDLDLEIGDKPFFLRAYCPRPPAG
jgi:hypothetical protein